jgi:hypothetical protein
MIGQIWVLAMYMFIRKWRRHKLSAQEADIVAERQLWIDCARTIKFKRGISGRNHHIGIK